MPRFDGARERRDAHLFDAVKLAGADFTPEQHGRLFVPVSPTFGSPNFDKTPPSDVTFMLEEVQVEVRGSREEAKVLTGGVRFEIIVGESRWPVRGVFEEGLYGERYVPRAHPSEPNKGDRPIYIPARQYFAIAYDLSDAALKILSTQKDAGLKFHLLGKFMRDIA